VKLTKNASNDEKEELSKLSDQILNILESPTRE